MAEEIKTPKVFASYSWKPDKDKEFVKEICDRLKKEAGIEVILDRYELKPGQDKYVFMETMVNDPTVDKVLVFSNKIYAEKANKREGGVGAESTMISNEVYANAKQEKFIPICLGKNENAEPFFPTFMQALIHIDFSEEDLIEDEFEKLVRFIYNKPLDVPPKLGTPPKYLLDTDIPKDSTRHKVERFKRAVEEGKTNVTILIEDYLDSFCEILSQMKVEDDTSDNPLDEKVYNMVVATKHLRNEFLDFYGTLIKLPMDLYIDMLHRHIEQWSDFTALEETYYNEEKTKRCSQHYKFLFKELFMYMIAMASKKEKFDLIASLVNELYLVKNSTNEREHRNFSFLHKKIEIFDINRNKRLNTNKKSLATMILIERMDYKSVNFTDLQDTDRLLYCLALLSEPRSFWFPYLTIWDYKKITIMKKAESKKYFDKVKVIFNVDSLEELKERINAIGQSKRAHLDWDYGHEDIMGGLNVNNLATL